MLNSRLLSAVLVGAWMLAPPASADDAAVLQELRDRAEIEALVARYVTALDTLDADGYAGVFAEDADFDVAGTKYHGRGEIVKVVTGLKESRAAAEAEGRTQASLYHTMSNTAIEIVDADQARHASYWQTVRVGPDNVITVGAMGRYEDVLVKRDGQWLIRSRKVVPFTN
jgi:uncharacterized protein (TIGR02246 family)